MASAAIAFRPEAAAPAPEPARRVRIESVDVVRGIIMILMALDHTRDFFGNAAASPTNLATTTAALFFTRWITHFCAPVFALLTGTGAYLARRRRTTNDLALFLLTRGLWLVLLELTVMRFFWQFNVDYHLVILDVLWSLGCSMIALAALVYLPVSVVTAIGVVMIAGHNLLDGVQPASLGALAPLWHLLHAPGVVYASPGHTLFTAYPLIPWIGVVAVGYGLGAIYAWPAERRRALLARLGVGMTVAFVLLRALNVYGDPARWSVQHSSAFTLLSFLNTTKYPPSLLFLLMTLGPALLLLRAMDGGVPRALRPAVIIGKVPFFYYVMHVVFLHVGALVASAVRYGTARYAVESPTLDRFPMTQPPGWPASLPVVYLLWVCVVIALYPLCRWYAGLKRRSASPWLSYL